MKWLAFVALSSGVATTPLERRGKFLLAFNTTTSDCADAGSIGGTAPGAGTVVFKPMLTNPILIAGINMPALFSGAIWVATAAKFGSGGGNGLVTVGAVGIAVGLPAGSRNAMPSWPSGA